MQGSTAFLAPGISFTEYIFFSMDWGAGDGFRVHASVRIYCHRLPGRRQSSGGIVSDEEWL